MALTDVKCLCLSREAFNMLRGSMGDAYATQGSNPIGLGLGLGLARALQQAVRHARLEPRTGRQAGPRQLCYTQLGRAQAALLHTALLLIRLRLAALGQGQDGAEQIHAQAKPLNSLGHAALIASAGEP